MSFWIHSSITNFCRHILHCSIASFASQMSGILLQDLASRHTLHGHWKPEALHSPNYWHFFLKHIFIFIHIFTFVFQYLTSPLLVWQLSDKLGSVLDVPLKTFCISISAYNLVSPADQNKYLCKQCRSWGDGS